MAGLLQRKTEQAPIRSATAFLPEMTVAITFLPSAQKGFRPCRAHTGAGTGNYCYLLGQIANAAFDKHCTDHSALVGESA